MTAKIVIDTNLIISAFLNPHGKPAAIIDATIDDQLTLVTSPGILDEARRVFSYPKLKKWLKKNNVSKSEAETYLERLKLISQVVPGEMKIDVVNKDPDDNIILACAQEGNADYIVSGDKHLIDLKFFNEIEILKPADFLARVFEE